MKCTRQMAFKCRLKPSRNPSRKTDNGITDFHLLVSSSVDILAWSKYTLDLDLYLQKKQDSLEEEMCCGLAA